MTGHDNKCNCDSNQLTLTTFAPSTYTENIHCFDNIFTGGHALFIFYFLEFLKKNVFIILYTIYLHVNYRKFEYTFKNLVDSIMEWLILVYLLALD